MVGSDKYRYRRDALFIVWYFVRSVEFLVDCICKGVDFAIIIICIYSSPSLTIFRRPNFVDTPSEQSLGM